MRKNNLRKRLAAIAATATVLVSMLGSTVMAYTPDPSEEGTITVHKYSRTTEAVGENPTGELIADTSGLGTPLPGAGFTLYYLSLPDLGDEEFTGGYVVDTIAGTVTFNTTGGTETVSYSTVAGAEKLTGTEGTVKFENVAQGYYVLVETKTPEGYDEAPASVISLPLTNKFGTGFNFDIHVYPKNISTMPITKLVDDATKTYQVGDEVDFTINAGISNQETDPSVKVDTAADLEDSGIYGSMEIFDTLVKGLKYVSSELNFLTANNTKVLMVLDTDYTLAGESTGELVWKLTQTGIDKAISEGAVAVEVKLVTEVLASSEALTNSAGSRVVKAGGDPEEVTPPVTPPVEVPTGNIEVNKYDAETDVVLPGAVFALAKGDSSTDFLKPDGSTKNIADHSTLAADTDIILGTTNADGKIVFSGLEYDKINGSEYRLVEVKAPEGYQLKEAAIIADFEENIDGANVKISVNVPNYKNGTVDPDNPKFSLPLTGSTGTIMFTIIGVLIMVAVTVTYIYSKKKNRV